MLLEHPVEVHMMHINANSTYTVRVDIGQHKLYPWPQYLPYTVVCPVLIVCYERTFERSKRYPGRRTRNCRNHSPRGIVGAESYLTDPERRVRKNRGHGAGLRQGVRQAHVPGCTGVGHPCVTAAKSYSSWVAQ
jgi:hypothetical protein